MLYIIITHELIKYDKENTLMAKYHKTNSNMILLIFKWGIQKNKKHNKAQNLPNVQMIVKINIHI